MSEKFEVGQKVVIWHPERIASTHEASKVRRSLLYAGGLAFRMENGSERRDRNSVGYAYHLYTTEEWVER